MEISELRTPRADLEFSVFLSPTSIMDIDINKTTYSISPKLADHFFLFVIG